MCVCVWAWSTRRGLKPKFYRLLRTRSLWGSSPTKENSHGGTGNRTRDLMASSQKFWPPSHKAVQFELNIYQINFRNVVTGRTVRPICSRYVFTCLLLLGFEIAIFSLHHRNYSTRCTVLVAAEANAFISWCSGSQLFWRCSQPSSSRLRLGILPDYTVARILPITEATNIQILM
jgi:hypothetical protein